MSQKETPLSERVVKEAINVGMDSPMRDPILEAVKEAEGSSPPAKRMIPAAGTLLGIGAAIGYLLGRSDLPDAEMKTEMKEELSDVEVPTTGEELMADTESESESDESTGRGRGLLSKAVFLGVAVAAGLAWRRRQAAGDEWEPIEEFEPATDAVSMETEEDEEESEATSEGEDETEADAESAGDAAENEE